MIWAVHAETRLVEAFIASGSALSTLGFRTPPSTLGQVLAIPEGAIGLGVVVFIFTFIPGYKAAVLAREDKTALLYARTRGVMTGVELLRSAQRGDTIGDMSDNWQDAYLERIANARLGHVVRQDYPVAIQEALREAAFRERLKIHDIILEGIEVALRNRGRRK